MADTQPATTDRVDFRRYHTAIPNMVDDMGLDPYSFRLYAHIKRVAGDDGVCWQAESTMANLCCMSKGQVGKSKRVLQDKGLIKIIYMVNPHGGKAFHHILIVDVWADNEARFSSRPTPHSDLATPQNAPPTPQNAPPTPHSDLATPQGGVTTPQGGIKKNPTRRTHEEEPMKKGEAHAPPPLSAGQKRVLDILGRDKFPNVVQADTVLSLEQSYGFETLERSAVWMARGNKPFDINILSGACRTFAEGDLSPPRKKGGKLGDFRQGPCSHQESDEEYYAPDGISTIIDLDH